MRTKITTKFVDCRPFVCFPYSFLVTLDRTINQFFSSHFAKYLTDIFLSSISGACSALGSQLS